ncbi:hypothetical protein EJ08DRAFT_578554 [Tothia fuscella]|uniref:EGF-like domain-containing protein n=1 Tax=Tothia fuscella TaxID=1048955 RepID=A0A9P4P3Q9_9PEZI|nr:hypothetical protein EJ08DRAFT_578554 [Tothia fuscella]
MSYRGGGGPEWAQDEPRRGQLQKGSVRAARERAQAERAQAGRSQWEKRQQGLESLDPPPPTTGAPLASQYLAGNSPENWRSDQIPEGPHLSPPEQPTPGSPQWPLTQPSSSLPAPSQGRTTNPPVEPPPRALNQATFLDTSRDTMSPNTLQAPQAAYWQDDDYLSPSYGSPQTNRPLTDSSFVSEGSSVGTIPDFPVPFAQLRRIQQPYLGPPPSARRGPSSYYSQISYVSPIAEESSVRGSVGSYASSNVFPAEKAEFYLEDASDDEDLPTPKAKPSQSVVLGHDVEGRGLVRQASLGKRTKPTLTTIKSVETLRPVRRTGTQPSIDQGRSSLEIMTGNLHTSAAFGLRSPTSRTAPMSPLVPADSRIEHILGGLEKGGALAPGAATQEHRSTLADRVGTRRPARLNVNAVRDAEARSSLTSLPDLIRRATRLAANLDRGKTASRLGFEWLETGSYEKQNSPDMGDNMDRRKTRRSTTLSGMLSAFPPPGAATPRSPRTEWPTSNGSSAKGLNARGREGSAGGNSSKRRRCCGLPLFSFILLVTFLVVLVAAAIVIPVVLIALPKRNAATDTSRADAIDACQKNAPCENGGGSVVNSDGTCGCLCTNGFTGPRCQNPSDFGCTTKPIAGVKNASMGSSIPPLLEVAANHSIPLDGQALLSLFAAINMTCGAENALVTLTGSPASKRSDTTPEKASELKSPSRLEERASPPAVTSNRIVVDGSKPTQTISSAPVSTSVVTIATGSSAPGTNSTSKDFAKVGVLFVLQESKQINVAIKAQEQLSKYMNLATQQGSTMTDAHNITLGGGYFIDLWYWTVTLSNGTVYGQGFNGTALMMPPT